MEQFKKKLETLRQESEAASIRADEAEKKVKQLDAEHISKDHEITSLQNKNKILEEQVDKLEATLTETTKNFQEADLKAETFERRVAKLETEVAEKEKNIEEVQEKYKVLKAEYEEFAKSLDDA